jgi:hypothetical protein
MQRGEFVMNVEVGLGDFVGERPEAASFVISALIPDVERCPFPKPGKVLESVELFRVFASRSRLPRSTHHIESRTSWTSTRS